MISNMRSYSAFDPSHHSIASGPVRSAICSTQASRRAWRVGGDFESGFVIQTLQAENGPFGAGRGGRYREIGGVVDRRRSAVPPLSPGPCESPGSAARYAGTAGLRSSAIRIAVVVRVSSSDASECRGEPGGCRRRAAKLRCERTGPANASVPEPAREDARDRGSEPAATPASGRRLPRARREPMRYRCRE